LISRDGTEVSIADRAPIKDEQGNLLGTILVFRDVTREREQQTAIQNTKRQLGDIIEFLPDVKVGGWSSVKI